MNKYIKYIGGQVVIWMLIPVLWSQDLQADLDKIYAHLSGKEGFGLTMKMQYYNARGIPEQGEEVEGYVVFKGAQFFQQLGEEAMVNSQDYLLSITPSDQTLVLYPPEALSAQSPTEILRAFRGIENHTFGEKEGVGIYTFSLEGPQRFPKIKFSFDMSSHQLMSYELYSSRDSEESVRIFYEPMALTKGEIREKLKLDTYIKKGSRGLVPQAPFESFQIIDLTAQP
ncbi:MAG: hypothetical protein AAFW00_24140 [Bacteroidota bacterium]